MNVFRLVAGRGFALCSVLALLLSAGSSLHAADIFPFDRELLLDAPPMRPGKRMPVLAIEPNGNARIDMWCRTVPAYVEISEAAIKIEAGPLPEELPAMQSTGQCTPERIQADVEFLATLTQVTGWRSAGDGVVLEGPQTLKFRASDH